MLFLNIFFIFLFSLAPLHLSAGEPPHIQSSRNSSPVVKVAVLDKKVAVLNYEYPGSNHVYVTYVPCQGSESHETGYGRHSVPSPIPALEANISLASESKSSSLTDQSKLDAIRTVSNGEVLSQSTERFNFLKDELASLKQLVVQLSQKLPISPENPSK